MVTPVPRGGVRTALDPLFVILNELHECVCELFVGSMWDMYGVVHPLCKFAAVRIQQCAQVFLRVSEGARFAAKHYFAASTT